MQTVVVEQKCTITSQIKREISIFLPHVELVHIMSAISEQDGLSLAVEFSGDAHAVREGL